MAAILEGAAQVLEAGGLAAFTTNAVAERAGVSIGTLYQYFADKNALIQALAQRELQAALVRVRAALLGEIDPSPEGRVRAMVRAIVTAFRHRIINIHPSLLPFFPGAAPYKQAFESGVRVHGCTAHFVTDQLDEGPVILQDVFHINVGADTLEDVKQKGLELEAATLSKSVQLFLDEELVVVEGKVIFKPGLSRFLKESR